MMTDPTEITSPSRGGPVRGCDPGCSPGSHPLVALGRTVPQCQGLGTNESACRLVNPPGPIVFESEPVTPTQLWPLGREHRQ